MYAWCQFRNGSHLLVLIVIVRFAEQNVIANRAALQPGTLLHVSKTLVIVVHRYDAASFRDFRQDAV